MNKTICFGNQFICFAESRCFGCAEYRVCKTQPVLVSCNGTSVMAILA